MSNATLTQILQKRIHTHMCTCHVVVSVVKTEAELNILEAFSNRLIDSIKLSYLLKELIFNISDHFILNTMLKKLGIYNKISTSFIFCGFSELFYIFVGMGFT